MQLFLAWREYEKIEPFAARRADFQTANVVKALWDIARDTEKHPEPFPLSDFLVQYGLDAAPVRKPRQTWQEIKALLVSYAHASGD